MKDRVKPGRGAAIGCSGEGPGPNKMGRGQDHQGQAILAWNFTCMVCIGRVPRGGRFAYVASSYRDLCACWIHHRVVVWCSIVRGHHGVAHLMVS